MGEFQSKMLLVTAKVSKVDEQHVLIKNII